MELRIKEVMEELGVSSIELTKRTGLSKVSISTIINNKVNPSMDTLEKIAECLDVPVWQLMVSPKEMHGLVCPHCGRAIKLQVI